MLKDLYRFSALGVAGIPSGGTEKP